MSTAEPVVTSCVKGRAFSISAGDVTTFDHRDVEVGVGVAVLATAFAGQDGHGTATPLRNAEPFNDSVPAAA